MIHATPIPRRTLAAGLRAAGLRAAGLRAAGLLAAGLLAACGPLDFGDAPASVQQPLTWHAESQRLRVATFNTHLVPPAAYDEAGTALPPNWSGYGETEANANLIAAEILADPDAYDVIVFNEVFDADAQKALVAALSPTFPHWVGFLDGHVRNPLYEDSGLAVFSRYPFAPFDEKNTFGDEWDAWTSMGDVGCGLLLQAGGVACPDNLAFRSYTDCEDDDCKARKGVGLVRIVHAGHKYNIAFTHMQADYPANGEFYPGTRVRQLQTIHALLRDYVPAALDSVREDIVVLGDLNIEGWIGVKDFVGSTAAAPNGAMLASEYGQQIWGHLDGRAFFDAWRTTSPEDEGVTHRFPQSELGRLDHALVYGLGYHTPGAPTLSGPAFLSGDHAHQCTSWIHRTLEQAPSDHVGVALELSPRGAACRPDLAVKPLFPPGGAFVDVVHLDRPGQVKWYRVDDPGTFSIGFMKGVDPKELVVEVFPATNLAHPLASVNGEPVKKFKPEAACHQLEIEHCVFHAETFFPGNAPFYVRVSAPSGLVTGSAAVGIFKHDCSTEDVKCWLRPGDAPRVETGDPSQHTFFYALRTYAAFDGATQHLEIDVNTAFDPLSVTLWSRNDGELLPETGKRSWLGTFDEASDDEYLLRIRRTAGQPFDVAWRTDLTFFFGGTPKGYAGKTGGAGGASPLSLYCANETEGDALGSDEILVQVGTVAGAVHFERFWPEVNTTDRLGFADMAPIAVVGSMRVTIAELSTESLSHDHDDWDDLVYIDLPGLDPKVLESLGQVRDTPLYDYDDGEIDWGDDYGGYQLTFNQTHSLGGGQP